MSKLYDLDFLNNISNGDQAFIREMIDSFFESSQDYINKVNIASDTSDYETIGKATHKYIPGISFMGMKTLEHDLLFIEEYCKKQTNLDKIPELLSNVKATIVNIGEAFKRDFSIEGTIVV